MVKNELHEFFCLSRDLTQRRNIERVLGREGSVHWISVRPISLYRYQEAHTVAEAALANSPYQPSGFMRAFKMWQLRAQYSGARRLFRCRKSAVAVAWGGNDGGRMAFMEGARAAGARRLYLEHSPVPGRITVDPRGVGARSSLPRTIEPYTAWADKFMPDLKAWRAERRGIRQRAKIRFRVNEEGTPRPNAPFLFVPLQIPCDAFVSVLASAAAWLPDGWYLRLKEHPSTRTSAAERIREADPDRIFLDNYSDTFAQVAESRGVVTFNSSVGIQAFYFDKPVVVCGPAYWAIPGVATPAPSLNCLKDVLAAAETLRFDTDSRDVFMTYLSSVYFPTIDGSGSAASISERLAGADTFGFWSVEP